MKYTGGFPVMADIIPASPKPEGAGWYIVHVEVGEEYVKHARLRVAVTGQTDLVEPGTYVLLKHRYPTLQFHEDTIYNETVWMSDLYVERDSNRDILRAARGDVLLVGLGIGMVAVAICRKPEVTSVTVLELEPDVIRLVAPHIRHGKLRVVAADGWKPPLKGRHFDVIYVDVWSDICVDNWADYKALCRKYRSFARTGGLVTAWQKDHLQYLVRSGRWR